jgi:hypothetical protein
MKEVLRRLLQAEEAGAARRSSLLRAKCVLALVRSRGGALAVVIPVPCLSTVSVAPSHPPHRRACPSGRASPASSSSGTADGIRLLRCGAAARGCALSARVRTPAGKSRTQAQSAERVSANLGRPVAGLGTAFARDAVLALLEPHLDVLADGGRLHASPPGLRRICPWRAPLSRYHFISGP